MPSKLTLNTPIEDIFMIGPAYARRLKKLNISTAEDLLHHYPSRYQDFSFISPIAKIKPGETVTIQGKIISCDNIYTKRGKKIQKAVITDKSGQIEAVWFNQTFIPKTLKPGLQVSFSGKAEYFGPHLTLTSPEYEIIKKSPLIHTGRLVPVYPETAGVSSKWLRSRINLLLKQLLRQLPDWLPPTTKNQHRLIDLASALQQIHFPQNKAEISSAKQRLSFDELFLLQLEALLRQKSWQQKKLAHQLHIDQEKILQLINSLPFKLTSAQNQVIKTILADLASNHPMNRLLQGDVGSGKTVVAAIAIYAAHLNGLQSAVMAPTEILAQQHFQTLKTVFSQTSIKLSLITATTKKLKPDNCRPKADILIGTHALLFRRLDLTKLGLIVIDEQHRFGVQQRAKLINLAETPHLLTMTATPIPRTIALTLYGDLDLSVIDEMPTGRQSVKTWVVPPKKRLSAYRWIEKEITTHRSQAFIVCPLIEESDKETMKDIRAASAEFSKLQQIFPDLKLALLHGRMKSAAKEKAIKSFRQAKTQILVSTPVIEVGIDIPNATIIIIEDAERFGLAQLHQLRGRVGRGGKASYCLLFSQSNQPQVIKRLQQLETHHSGLKLAEIDLKLRGPGEIYGIKQHGFFQLKLASFTDQALIKLTRQAAASIQRQGLSAYPLLKQQLKKRTMSQIAPN